MAWIRLRNFGVAALVIELSDGAICSLLSLPDLVQAKKTQRDKDWPMIRRLLEAHYFQNRKNPSPAQVKFWLMELRTASLLIEVARAYPGLCRQLTRARPLFDPCHIGCN